MKGDIIDNSKIRANPDKTKTSRQQIFEVHTNKNYEVPDPYYGGDQGFENVYQMLDEACNIIAEKLL